jgi:glycosyltransferase involved in cell wall biosynthesis
MRPARLYASHSFTMERRFSCVHFLREIRAELGGVVTAVIDLCQSMAARGHPIVVMTCDGKDAPARWRGEGNWPEVIEVPHSAFTGLLLSRRGLRRFEEVMATIDVAHLHTPWDLCNFQLMRLLRRARVPYIVTVHGMLDAYSMAQKSLKKHTFLSAGGRSLFRNATSIHFTAQAEMEQALQFVPGRDRSRVQACALDFSPYRDLPGPEPALKAFPQIRREARKILFLSRVHPKKGLDLLIRAAGLMKRGDLPFQVLVAGPGEEKYINSLKALAAELGVASDVEFLGMVQGVEKRSLYQAADAFVLPTHQENFGLVLAEAMACGTPVITTRGADIWHELQQGGARIVEQSPDKIAAAIVEVVSNLEKCRQVGQQGLEFVYHWLDRDRVSAAYEEMYFDAIARGIPPFKQAAVRPQGEPVAAR